MMDVAQLLLQVLALIVAGGLFYQLGKLVGAVRSLTDRVAALEGWRDSNLQPLNRRTA